MQGFNELKYSSIKCASDIKYPHSILISHLGDKVVFISEHDSINILDLTTSEHVIYTHKGGIRNISLSDNNLLAISGINSSLMDLVTMKEFIKLPTEFSDEQIEITINKAGTKIYLANAIIGSISIYNISTGKVEYHLTNAPQNIVTTCISPNEVYYYCRSLVNGGESIWEISTGKKVMEKVFKNTSGPSNPFVCFHPFLPVIASGSKKGLIMLLNLEIENILSMQSISEFQVKALSFLPDGKQLIVATADGMVHFMDLSGIKS